MSRCCDVGAEPVVYQPMISKLGKTFLSANVTKSEVQWRNVGEREKDGGRGRGGKGRKGRDRKESV